MRSVVLGDAVRIGLTYAGTVIGAGFASGQEIAQFFVSFGKNGLLGILVSTVLFAWLGGRLLELGHRLRAPSYHQAIYHVCGPRAGVVLDGATVLFLFAALAVMLAGMATVGRDHLGLPFEVGLALAGGAAALTVLSGIRGIAAANMLLAPLLAACLLLIGCYSLIFHAFEPGMVAVPPAPLKQAAPHWLLASLLYVSYNIMLGATVLVPLGNTVPRTAGRLGGGLFGGLALGGMAAFLTLVLMVHHPQSLGQEVPVLEVVTRQHPFFSALYSLVLTGAMFTTALASLYGCAGKLTAATGIRPAVAVVIIVAASLACAPIGFAKLIRLLFPVFGYISLAFTGRLAWLSLRGSLWR